MRYFFTIVFLFLLSLARGTFASGDVFINEVAWTGTLSKDGESTQTAANNEWIELYNPTSVAVSLNGWKIMAEDGTPDILLSGSMKAFGFFLLERTDDNTVLGITADQIYTGALEDAGEKLFLKNSSGSVVDEVDASLGWPAGNKEIRETMQKVSGVWITASSTPRAPNVGGHPPAETGVPSPTPSESRTSSGTSGSYPPPQQISAYAGEDREVAVGLLVYFLGHATGFDGKTLDNARFWWNYGDGETKEGRSVSHIFRIPGSYTVGLHISSGSYAASDYLKVEVIPNKIEISRVIVGKEGFLEFFNSSNLDTDIGGWILEDKEGKRFNVPPKTIVGGAAKVSFTNMVTGLLLNPHSLPLAVYYPNSVLLMKKEFVEEKLEEVKPRVVLAEKTKDLTNVSSPSEVRPVELPKRNSEKKDEYIPEEHKEVASVYSSSSRSTAFFLLSLTFGILISLGFLAAKHIRL